MELDHEDVKEGLGDLLDEQLHSYVPYQVANAWLAVTEGKSEASYVTRASAEPTGTRWEVFAVTALDLVIIQGTSDNEYWSRDDDDDKAEVTAEVCSRGDITSLRLLNAYDADSRGWHYQIHSRWAVDLADGRSFTVAQGTTLHHTTRARAERFITALRALMAGWEGDAMQGETAGAPA